VEIFYAALNHVNTIQIQDSDGMLQEDDLLSLCLHELEEEVGMKDLHWN